MHTPGLEVVHTTCRSRASSDPPVAPPPPWGPSTFARPAACRLAWQTILASLLSHGGGARSMSLDHLGKHGKNGGFPPGCFFSGIMAEVRKPWFFMGNQRTVSWEYILMFALLYTTYLGQTTGEKPWENEVEPLVKCVHDMVYRIIYMYGIYSDGWWWMMVNVYT